MSDETQDKKEVSEDKPSRFIVWLQYQHNYIRIPLLILLSLIFVSIGIGLLYIFYVLITKLWSWGFTDGGFWSGVFAIIGAFILITIPTMSIIFVGIWFENVFDVFANDAQKEFKNKLKEIETERISYEEKLEKTDSELLIPLITYSKLELETYYNIGLNQTQKSYKHYIIAMWTGFVIIMFGILMFILPIKTFFPKFEIIPNEIKIMTVSSGIIVQLISVLFLGIYKNSMKQLTYFYNRQIFIHNSLFAFRIAQTMENSDDAKKEIVSRILDFNANMKTVPNTV